MSEQGRLVAGRYRPARSPSSSSTPGPICPKPRWDGERDGGRGRKRGRRLVVAAVTVLVAAATAVTLHHGWKVKKGPSDEVTCSDPSGPAGITIGMVDPAGSHPVERFRDIEANTKVNYPTYRRLRLQKTTFMGKPAAVREFTFQGRARAFRAIDLGYGTPGGREYDIYLSAPDARWSTYRPVFDAVRDGFAGRPRGGRPANPRLSGRGTRRRP